MGYHIDQLASQFHIKSEAAHYAHAVIRILCAPGKGTIRDSSGCYYSWVDSAAVIKASTFQDVMDAWRYHLTKDARTGDFTSITFKGQKAGDEEVLFQAIAPYVTAGSYIEFRGEDNARWRWVFDGTTATYQCARLGPLAITRRKDPHP